MIKPIKFIKWIFIVAISFVLMLVSVLSAREVFHTNKGESISHGSRSDGSLENAWLLPYSGKNYKYFSFYSYYIMDNAYLNNKVCTALEDAYKTCETSTPEIFYRYMECSDHDGGPVYFHKSHRNGLSVDFMVPKIRNEETFTSLDSWGFAHYFLEFDNTGKLTNTYPFLNYIHPSLSNIVGRYLIDEDVKVDFENMAKHILALDDACKKEHIAIRKVIMKLEYKDEFFKTPSGKKVKARGIPFAQKLSPAVNGMHDDHYHIDFKIN